jgi:NAD(P)-dependent dehydrogenase (short-subunit alcohol dehydrogenase family)
LNGAGELTPAAVRELAPARHCSLAGRVAVVTGAAGGIGRWLAAGLGAAGASVLLTDMDGDELASVTELLRAAGVRCECLVADLSAEGAAAQIVDGAVSQLGRLDILVNNAAINRPQPMLDMDEETWDRIFAVDLRAPYFLSQRAAARMIEQGSGGAIVSISSLNAIYALEHVSVYAPAKAGLIQLTRVMALEWARHGIRANAIAPGFMDAPLAARNWAVPDVRRWILNRVPMERPGRPDELVGACVLLASDAGSFITGQTLVIDGGVLAGGRWRRPDR